MVSWLPLLSSFLCCFGVEAGSKIIGVLHMLISLSLVVVFGYFSSSFHEMSTSGDPEGVYHKWFVVTLVATLLNVGHVVLSVVLLYGIRKRRSRLVGVWVVLMMCLAAVACFMGLGLTFSSATGNIFYTMIVELAFFLLLLYCITVVNSYYLMLKSTEEMEGPKSDY